MGPLIVPLAEPPSTDTVTVVFGSEAVTLDSLAMNETGQGAGKLTFEHPVSETVVVEVGLIVTVWFAMLTQSAAAGLVTPLAVAAILTLPAVTPVTCRPLGLVVTCPAKGGSADLVNTKALSGSETTAPELSRAVTVSPFVSVVLTV